MKKLYFFFLILLQTQVVFALTVTRVIDGDTVVLSDKRHIRLIGIDTPESLESRKLQKDVIRTGKDKATIKALGKRSAAFTRDLVEGKTVTIKYDHQKKDKYRRTLGYIYLKDGTFVNLEIVRQGYANAYTRFPFKFMEQFRVAEVEAREKGRGLWKDGGLEEPLR